MDNKPSLTVKIARKIIFLFSLLYGYEYNKYYPLDTYIDRYRYYPVMLNES